jgi:DNA (cytosine-5)-methyltransferase 1
VLNAKDYGIPQNRERVFIVSIRKDIDTGSFTFPEPIPLELRLKDLLEDEVDKKYYINTPTAQNLIDELIESGKLDKEISNTVRAGGRESIDRHQWDMVQV